MSTTTSMDYPFTEDEMTQANETWGCNCGPTALAFALQVKLDAVRHAIPGFEQKGYTSPTMMKDALAFFRRAYRVFRVPPYAPGQPIDVEAMFDAAPSLVRVQWTGPWTKAGANPRWAYGYTHWIATWSERGVPLVFDCNDGVSRVSGWVNEIAPMIIQTIPRATGEWFPTHIWRLA